MPSPADRGSIFLAEIASCSSVGRANCCARCGRAPSGAWEAQKGGIERLACLEKKAAPLTRAKLLASAREVVAREGYEHASVDRIAEEGFTAVMKVATRGCARSGTSANSGCNAHGTTALASFGYR